MNESQVELIVYPRHQQMPQWRSLRVSLMNFHLVIQVGNIDVTKGCFIRCES